MAECSRFEVRSGETNHVHNKICARMIAWTIYITFGGAVLLLLLPAGTARWMALIAALAGGAISVMEFFKPGADLAHFTTVFRVPWVPTLGMNYHLAADGISLTMVLVTS